MLASTAAQASDGGGASGLLVFLAINFRHVVYAVALSGLFPILRGLEGAPRGRHLLSCSVGILLLAWLLVFSAPFSADASWLRAGPFACLLTFCIAGSALIAWRPQFRPFFPAFSGAAVISGLIVLATTGMALPLLVAELLALMSLLLWGVSYAAGNEHHAHLAAELGGEASCEKAVKEAIARERARYIQDMHDGLGAELVSTLAAVKNGGLSNDQMASSLQACLDQMRLSIDAGGVATEDLAVALANLRYRMEPRLRAAGIVLSWNVLKLPDELSMEPEKALCVLRVVQESLANALKYSQATRIEFSAAVEDCCLKVSVTDNGKGMKAEGMDARTEGNGLGMAGMQRRIQAAGGIIKVLPASGHAGVSVQMALPL